jgi:hypothetical protein
VGFRQPGFGSPLLVSLVPVGGHPPSCQHLRFVGMAGGRSFRTP